MVLKWYFLKLKWYFLGRIVFLVCIGAVTQSNENL